MLQIAVLEFDVGISVERTEDVAHVVSMSTQTLPPANVMLAAFLERDASYDGIFLTGVRTTGIFCRPICSAKKPLPENIDFFPSSGDALHAGFRPCNRCRPMGVVGDTPGVAEGASRGRRGRSEPTLVRAGREGRRPEP